MAWKHKHQNEAGAPAWHTHPDAAMCEQGITDSIPAGPNSQYPGFPGYGETEKQRLNRIADGNDPIDHPKHYTSHPSGVECITITEHMGFNLGNALKYVWRADLMGDAIQDLEKARWYIDRELEKRRAGA